MDLLRKELERKRKTVALAKKSKNVQRIEKYSTTTTETKVYLKTADLRRFQEKQDEIEKKSAKNVLHGTTTADDKEEGGGEKRQRKRRRRHEGEEDDDTEAKAGEVSMGDNDEARSKGEEAGLVGGNSAEESNKDTVEVQQQMTTEEITKSLRNFNLPVWLFGERTNQQRSERLSEAIEKQKTTMAGIHEMDEFRLGSGHGIRNPFLGDKKKKKEQEEDITTTKHEEHKDQQQDTATTVTIKNIDDDPHKSIHRFFKSLLRQWEEDLMKRPESIKRTAAGKNETKTLKQCKDYIRPLFKLCKTRKLGETMKNHILNIVRYCQDGEFVKAHDAYMDMAIGRAAWPIGVTMVGIHARSGRARIESSNVAHVMNSELQRKYLTSVKRLMTYYQKKREDVAPSKKVTN